MSKLNEKTRRAISKPQWFGKRAAPHVESSPENEPECYRDNSDDDLDYVPNSQELMGLHSKNATDSSDRGPLAKKKKTVNQNEVQQNNFGSTAVDVITNDIVLNDEFDAIDALTKLNSRPSAEVSAQHVDKRQPNPVMTSHSAQHHDGSQSKSYEADLSCPTDVQVDNYRIQELLLKMLKNSTEILARIGVLEETLVNNQMMKMKNVRSNESKAEIERFHLFMKSNDFPMTSLQQVDTIEAKLEDSAFMNAAVSILVI